MKRHPQDPTQQTKILKALLILIEDIRYKRQDEWRDRPHPLGRRFTQLELTQEALPTYGNLLAGRSKRIPARQQILDIADYLECTIAETNDLLLCAEYIPERRELTRNAYQKLLSHAQFLAHFISLPLYILKPDLEIVYANDPQLAIHDVSDLTLLPKDERNGICWYFSNNLPTYPWYNASADSTVQNARGLAEMLWITSRPYRHEQTFKAKLNAYLRFPEFKQQWEIVSRDGVIETDEYGCARMQTRFLDQPIKECPYLLPLSANNDLLLMVTAPMDEAARTVYRQVGCDINETRWEQMLAHLEASYT